MDDAGLLAAHVRNGAVDVSSRGALDAGDLLGGDSRPVMPRDRSVDVDDRIDVACAELRFERLGGPRS